jgi:NADH:ubiquinone oxidoreductase subunit F (NADH-binding)
VSEPRLLKEVSAAPMSYERHLRVHGERALGAPELLAELKRSGLRGRGGGAFPLATKLDAVRRARGAPILVVNGCEGEPMSAKDRLLLSCAPHLVLDGALWLAAAIAATEVIVAVDRVNVLAGETVEWALAQRPEAGRARKRTHLLWIPSGYVSGHESALVRWCNDGVAKPASAPPRVSERGVARRPTLVVNVETLAHVALIARHGGAWFAARGTDADPGSLLVTVGGAVRHPGVYETDHGASLRSLMAAAGGVAQRPRAFLVGGFAGGWIGGGDARSARLSRRDLRPFGARPGPGVVVALPDSACAVTETARVAGWLAQQSSGQCGPCVNGLGAIAGGLAAVRGGGAGLENIARWCGLAAGRGACAHPDGAAAFVTSALRVFADELLDHARHGPCEACDRPPVLEVPGAVG